MGAYDAVLFDFDGVLVDSEPLHYQCWREVLLPWNVDLDWGFYAGHCIGVSDRDMLAGLSSLAPHDADPLPVREVYERKRELFRERSGSGALVTPEMRALVRELTVPLAVVSSSPGGDVEPLLVAAGIRDCFAACVFRESVARPKPHPEPYLTAARWLGSRRPLAVEDSDAGAASARAAGFDCLRIARPADTPGAVRARLAGDL